MLVVEVLCLNLNCKQLTETLLERCKEIKECSFWTYEISTIVEGGFRVPICSLLNSCKEGPAARSTTRHGNSLYFCHILLSIVSVVVGANYVHQKSRFLARMKCLVVLLKMIQTLLLQCLQKTMNTVEVTQCFKRILSENMLVIISVICREESRCQFWTFFSQIGSDPANCLLLTSCAPHLIPFLPGFGFVQSGDFNCPPPPTITISTESCSCDGYCAGNIY